MKKSKFLLITTLVLTGSISMQLLGRVVPPGVSKKYDLGGVPIARHQSPFSPDGTKVLTKGGPKSSQALRGTLYISNTRNGQVLDVFKSDGDKIIESAEWSPNGKSIFIITREVKASLTNAILWDVSHLK